MGSISAYRGPDARVEAFLSLGSKLAPFRRYGCPLMTSSNLPGPEPRLDAWSGITMAQRELKSVSIQAIGTATPSAHREET